MKSLSIRLVVVYAAILLLISMLFSCTTEKKVHKWNLLHQAEAAKYCAENFPARDSVSTVDSTHFDTLYVENETVLRDSFYIKGDTVVRVVDKKCPKVQTIIKTVTRETYVLRIDSAAVVAMRGQLVKQQEARQTSETRLQGTKEKLNRWRLIAICSISLNLILILLIAQKIFKRRT